MTRQELFAAVNLAVDEAGMSDVDRSALLDAVATAPFVTRGSFAKCPLTLAGLNRRIHDHPDVLGRMALPEWKFMRAFDRAMFAYGPSVTPIYVTDPAPVTAEKVLVPA